MSEVGIERQTELSKSTGESGVRVTGSARVTSPVKEECDLKEIGDKEHNEIIDVLNAIRQEENFSLRIPNIGVESKRVLIRFVTKTNANAEQAEQTIIKAQEAVTLPPGTKVFTQANEQKDIERIRDELSRTVGLRSDQIKFTELRSMPRYRATVGLSSSLGFLNRLNIQNRFGCITVLLHDSVIGNPQTKDYALTVAHLPDGTGNDDRCISEGDQVKIIGENNAAGEVIGHVVKVIHDNGDNKEFVDAALVELNHGVIENFRLQQSFSINGVRHRLLISSRDEFPQPTRVVLKAVDQTEDDYKGYISKAYLNILDDPGFPDMPKYKLVQLLKCNRPNDGIFEDGAIHSEGESGQLATYEPDPEIPGYVTPVVMITGVYPYHDEDGNEFRKTSVGVSMPRVLKRLSAVTKKPLQLFVSPQ